MTGFSSIGKAAGVRGCVLGNSHVGAIKAGWDRLDEASRPFAMDFFGSKRQSLGNTFIENGVLKSDDESVRKSLARTGGSAEIDLKQYKMFAIVGCGVHFRICGRMIGNASVYPDVRPKSRLVSKAMMLEAFVQRLSMTVAWTLADAISRATDAPIFILPEPLFDRRILDADDQQLMKTLHDRGLGRSLADTFDAAVLRSFSMLAAVVTQPPHTREDFMFTAPKYGVAAVGGRYQTGAPIEEREGDFTHKNGEFGEIMVRALLKAHADRVAGARIALAG